MVFGSRSSATTLLLACALSCTSCLHRLQEADASDDHADDPMMVAAVPAAGEPIRCLPELEADAALCRLVGQLDEDRRYQECAWVLKENGYPNAAKKYVRYIQRELAEGVVVKITRIEGGIGNGTGENYFVTFSSGLRAVYKPTADNHDPMVEVAAYRLDEILRLNLVPVTILRDVGGRPGSVQYAFSGSGTGWDDLFRGTGSKIQFFDALIANVDRHRGNWLFTYAGREYEGGRRVAIDHNRAFRYEEMGSAVGQLPTGSSDDFLATEQQFYRGLAEAQESDIREQLQGLLSENQLTQLLATRQKMLHDLCARGGDRLGC